MELGQTIITIASVLTALGVIFGVIFAVYKWYLKQEKQDKDIKAIKEEQTLLTYGVLERPKRTRLRWTSHDCDKPD
mgnify:CR=1 FL=1